MTGPLKITCPSCSAFCGFTQPDGSEPVYTGCHDHRAVGECPQAKGRKLDEDEQTDRVIASRPGVGCTSRRGQRVR